MLLSLLNQTKSIYYAITVLLLFNYVIADPTDGCDLNENEIFITSSGDVLYNVPTDIGGFQFNIDGASFLSASGGEAQNAGFVVQGGGATVLAFSFTGSTITLDCGLLTSLSLDAVPDGLSSLVFSDSSGTALDIVYHQASSDDGGCDEFPLSAHPDEVPVHHKRKVMPVR